MSKVIITGDVLSVHVKAGNVKRSGIYRYVDLSEEAKEKALSEVMETHVFDRDYVLAKQTGEYTFRNKAGYYKFLLELHEDTYWYKKSGKIAMRTNPLIWEGNELSVDNLEDDDETYKEAYIVYSDAEEYASDCGYASWEDMAKEFKEQKKLLGLKGKIQVKRKGDGFKLKVCRNFAYAYWKKHA